MALEKNWFTSPNYALDGTRGDTALRHALWWMKAFLTGGLYPTPPGPPMPGAWTVDQSCDGTNVSTSGDLWGTTFDPSKIVPGISGANHSWIVLKSPTSTVPSPTGPADTNWYLVIDYVRTNATVNDNCARFYMSKEQPSGGTASVMPTHLKQWSFCPTCKTVSTTSGQMPFHKSITSTTAVVTGYRMNGSISADGDFILYSSVDSGGYQYAFGFFTMKDARSWDYYPVLTYYGQLLAGNVTDGAGWIGNGNLSFWAAPFRSRTYDGSAEVECLALFPGYNTNGSGWVFLNDVLASANPNGTYDDFPVYVAALVQPGQISLNYSLKPSVKGRVPDMKQAPRFLANGATSPASAPYEYAKLGYFWLPWVSSSQPIL